MNIKMLGEDLFLYPSVLGVEFDVELNDELLEKGVCKIESVDGCDLFQLVDIEYAQRRAKEIIIAMGDIAQLERDASRMEVDI